MALYVKALAAAALARRVGIGEFEYFTDAAGDKIDHGAVDQGQTFGVDNDRNTFTFKHLIIVIDVVLLLGGMGLAYVLTLLLSKRPIAKIIEQIDPAQAAKKKRIRIALGPPLALAAGLFFGIALVSVLVLGKSILWLPL